MPDLAHRPGRPLGLCKPWPAVLGEYFVPSNDFFLQVFISARQPLIPHAMSVARTHLFFSLRTLPILLGAYKIRYNRRINGHVSARRSLTASKWTGCKNPSESRGVWGLDADLEAGVVQEGCVVLRVSLLSRPAHILAPVAVIFHIRSGVSHTSWGMQP